ncbi:MAG: hypothetical protein AB7I27_00510 [Bacteriovoracaceae bacterium]
MSSLYDKTLTEDAAEMLVNDLSSYEPEKIISALRLCRLELNRFPTLAEIIKRMSPKSEAGQSQEIVGNIFKAISWHGYTNPVGAREMIGEVGWKAVEFMGGWQNLCDAPSDDLNILRAQLRKSVESSVEEKTRCEILGIPFNDHRPSNIVSISAKKTPLRPLDFSNFLPKDLA